MENGEMGIGWPLGLGSMHMRLRLIDNMNVNMPLPLPVAAPEPRSLFFHSTSFSSFTSSTLDTESTISFFQDKSKTLGRLIGIRPRNQRSEPYLRNSVNQLEELEMLSSRNYLEHQNEHNNHDMKMCDGFCIPLICLVAKISGNKDGSKR